MIDDDRLEITPAVQLSGETSLPGDKSISHRLAMIGSVAEGSTVIHNFATSVDCNTTLECLHELGVSIKRDGTTVTVEGRGLEGLQKPPRELNAGNSGTTVRLMCGILAGFPFEVTFAGDPSLSRRPMNRIMEPLRRMGATIEAREDNYLPLRIEGGSLFAITYTLPVASAQVKSAVLLAGVHPRGITQVRETTPTRNHTEIALKEFGSYVEMTDGMAGVLGGRPLQGKEFFVPGDISSAAFLIVAGLCVPNSRLVLKGIGLNPTRSGIVSLLQDIGAKISIGQLSMSGGEAVGDITVESSELSGMDIGGAWIPNVIDEIPILAALGARTQKGIRIRDASELRLKESDRLRAVAANLKALGAQVEEYPDGLAIPGGQKLKGGTVDSFGDHRIAMAFAAAALFAEGPVTIQNPSCADISFPGFFKLLDRLRSLG